MTVHLNPHKPVPALPSEGTIGVIAPAGPGALDTDKAVQWMRVRGYGLKVFPGVYEKDGYLAGSDDVRLRDLHAAFADPEVDAIICLRGGYGTPRLLDGLDFNLLRAAALAGQGVALCPEAMIRPDLEAGHLVRLSTVSVMEDYGYHLLSGPLAGSMMQRQAQAFRDWALAGRGV